MTDSNPAIIQKTLELCETIIAQPQFRSIQERMEAFESDPEAQRLYQIVVEQGEQLQQRQSMGLPLESEEMETFESHRKRLLDNPLAQGYMAAQEEMHQVQVSVRQYVTKTFELGRVPTAEDLANTCGSHCSCHH